MKTISIEHDDRTCYQVILRDSGTVAEGGPAPSIAEDPHVASMP